MKDKFCFENYKRLHFIGVGGVSMSGLALYSIRHKKTVSGSDICANEYFLKVKEAGAEVCVGHNENNVLSADAVIYTSAIDKNNCELVASKSNDIPMFTRSQMLGSIMEDYAHSVAIAGSHGKTTATAMLSNIFINANLCPTVFCGGMDKNFGNFVFGNKNFVIAEACEYKKNLLDIRPSVAVILNIDNDHLDSYSNMSEMIDVFSKFASYGIAILNYDDQNCKKIANSSVLSFGIKNQACIMAKKVRFNGKGYSFTLTKYGIKEGVINLNIEGEHNIYNALSAISVCELFKIPFKVIKKSLEEFTNVSRRNEKIGEYLGCEITADYAHHPSEIRAIISAKKESGAFTVFQPHTFSRTKILMEDFVDVLKEVKNLVIFKTYPAREEYDFRGDGKTLYKNLKSTGKKDCFYADNPLELEKLMSRLKGKNGKALVLGAGDIYQILEEILNTKT